ncbi:MAG: protein-disulfide reductase DsbD [Steroidobacteraceae bacterium]
MKYLNMLRTAGLRMRSRAWLPGLALAALAGTALAAPAAEPEFLPPEQAFRHTVDSDGARLTVHWTVTPGYYLYLKRMGVEGGADWAKLGAPAWPRGETHKDEYFGEQTVFRGRFDVSVPITRSDGATTARELPVTLKLQGCADAGLCYPPMRWTANVRVPAAATAAAATTAAASTAASTVATAATSTAAGNAPASPALAAAFDRARGGSNDADFLPVDEAFRLEVFADGPDRVKVAFQIADGYYLYRKRLSVAAERSDVTLGALALPKGEDKTDEFFGTQEVYHSELVASLPVSRAGGAALELPLVIGFQGCAEAGLCYPPEKKHVKVTLPAGSGSASAGAAAGAAAGGGTGGGGYVSEQDRLAALIRSGNLGLVLATFFGLGLLLAFTPCVLPMVPILSGIIAGQGENVTTQRAFALSLTYVLGMALTNTLAGIAAAAAGQQIQAAFQQPWIIVLFGLLFVALALSMFGLYTIQMPSAIQTRLTDVSNQQRAGTFGGVAIMGALSALIVTACVAPPLFATLAVIGQSGNMVRGGSALFSMSLGMGAPLLVIGTSAGKLLPRAGAWMDTVKKLFGVLMLGVAAWMFARIVPDRWALLLWAVPALLGAWLLWTEVRTRSVGGWVARLAGVALGAWGLALVAGAALGGHDPLAPIPQLARQQQGLEFKRIKSVADLEREVAAAAAAGRPVMLDFYADWCVSCKEMEKYTFTDAAVRKALERAVLLQADVTANDEQDQALLKRFGIFGPPTIAFYGPEGSERGNFRVVGFMKAGEFATLAASATAAATPATGGGEQWRPDRGTCCCSRSRQPRPGLQAGGSTGPPFPPRPLTRPRWPRLIHRRTRRTAVRWRSRQEHSDSAGARRARSGAAARFQPRHARGSAAAAVELRARGAAGELLGHLVRPVPARNPAAEGDSPRSRGMASKSSVLRSTFARTCSSTRPTSGSTIRS